MLSDIVFDHGQMVLGLRDRAGDQLGKYAGDTGTGAPGNYYYLAASGDVLRACTNATSGWTIENDGTCGGVTTTGSATNNIGPGGGEYYLGDRAPGTSGTAHVESSEGSMAQLPGAAELVMTAIDAVALNSGGIQWLNNTTGVQTDNFTIYQSTAPSGVPTSPATTGTPDATFGKSGGIGDIELLADPAPIEIGNRVWRDSNANGVQDPGEAGLSTVLVSLQTPTGTLTTNTASDGTYYFSGLRPNTAYTLTFPTTNSGVPLTKQDATGNSSNEPLTDTIDSDTDATTGKIFFSTGDFGENNHTLDVGYGAPPPVAQLEIVKTVTGGSSAATFSVNVQGPSGYNVITTVTTGAARVIANLAVGTYTVTEQTPLPTPPSGLLWLAPAVTSGGLIALTANQTTVVTITNQLVPVAPTSGSGLLTVTKSVNWAGSTPNPSQPFNITVNGPSGYVSNTSVTSGTSALFTNLAAGVYTVTEGSPGAGWITTYTVSGF